MRDDEFEWDDRKAASNARNHGVTFEEARAAFHDPDATHADDQTRTRSGLSVSADLAQMYLW
jgi:uncharacterized DUF497 family protein